VNEPGIKHGPEKGSKDASADDPPSPPKALSVEQHEKEAQAKHGQCQKDTARKKVAFCQRDTACDRSTQGRKKKQGS
jgi:hypothetical protein